MKYTIVFFILFINTVIFAQDATKTYVGKTYIFNFFASINECDDGLGKNPSHNATTAIKGTTFTVEYVTPDGDLVIKFKLFKKLKPANKNVEKTKYINLYNLKAPDAGTDQDNIKFFILSKSTFNIACSEYTYTQPWDISFGTMTSPFKFRSNPFLFQSNLNLGTSVSFQKKFSKNFSWGIIVGLSLSSITLDSFSTKGVVTTSTERPAVTPSLHGMIGYKTINITLGLGWDFVNLTSSLEKSWIYQGNRWIGIGIGVSLFNSNNNTSTQTSNLQ